MVSLTGRQGTVAAVPDFLEDTSSELERKSKALSVMALFESVTYCVLFYFWIDIAQRRRARPWPASSTASSGWRSWR